MNLNIDLHMHSTVSDGTDAPGVILEKVRELGLTHFSLTDHDSIQGTAVIKSILKQGDPVFINGVEFSCEDMQGKYHILGYGYDPAAFEINDLVEAGHLLRFAKVQKRLDFLEKEFGVTFPQEENDRLLALPNPGKPHIANTMIKYGYAQDINQAFKNYLNKYSDEDKHIAPEQAIRAILSSGGIPILAHPTFGSGAERVHGEDLENRIVRLMKFGLQGVEAYYSGFSEDDRKELLTFADRYDLYVTAGSDYHGVNKKVRLGDTHLDGGEQVKGLIRFLQDVKKN